MANALRDFDPRRLGAILGQTAPNNSLAAYRGIGRWLTGPVARDDRYGEPIQGDVSSLASIVNALVPHPGQSEEEIIAGTTGIMLPGGGVRAARELARGPVPESVINAIGWHGSPHKFAPTPKNALGEFDSSKIGTGEGAQAYGHGLYFAESPETAKTYAGAGEMLIGGKQATGPQLEVAELLEKVGGDVVKAREAIKLLSPRRAALYESRLDAIAAKGVSRRDAGSMYKVDIPDEHINAMLDWDKPLGEQGESVRKIFEQNFGYSQALTPAKATEVRQGIEDLQRQIDKTAGNPDHLYRKMDYLRSKLLPDATGAEMYRLLGTKTSEEASKKLREAGIPGIRYLDQGSRGAGQGTSNYVVFDPSITNILARE